MPRIYGAAEEVEKLASEILPTFHSELATARIRYIYVDKAGSKNGRPVLGKAKRINGAMEFLLETDFLIEVALDKWNEANARQRMALIDHLLENCTGVEEETSGVMKWAMREPDVREFTSILSRHGAWTEDLQGLVEVAQRLNLEARVQEVSDTRVEQAQSGA